MEEPIRSARGLEIAFELDEADSNRDLIRCLAEAIAYLESRIEEVDKSSIGSILGELMYEEHKRKFKYYEDK